MAIAILLFVSLTPIIEAQPFTAANSVNCQCPGQSNPPIWSHASFLAVQYSLNWAGYVAASSFSSPSASVTTVSGSWIVQNVASSRKPTYSSQWVGIGGYFSGDNTLIQTGTESDSANGATNYYSWYELLPASETPLGSGYPVSPGDIMSATISLTGTNTWSITLTDGIQWTFSKTVTYTSSQQSAEWIEERPSIAGSLTTLANFGTAQYGTGYTSVPNTNYATIGGSTSAAIGSFPYQSITMLNNPGRIIAQPSTLTYSGTSFTVTYK